MFLFISDLHLSAGQPHSARLFLDFLQNTASRAEALYILGDLFEYWAGDDDLGDAFNARIVSALRDLGEHGTALHIMRGNRDFLMGNAFFRACGAQELEDPAALRFYGARTLLTHGDTLCSGDEEYQAFRAQVRDPLWQKEFLARPLAWRKAEIEKMRAQSEQKKRGKPPAMMDVEPGAVTRLLRAFGYPRLIHGHTHRPSRHIQVVDSKSCERWALSDWHENGGGYLCCDESGCAAFELKP